MTSRYEDQSKAVLILGLAASTIRVQRVRLRSMLVAGLGDALRG